MMHLLPHLFTVPGFWSWLIAGHHWPTAQHGCRWEFGHGPGQPSRWLRICHPRPALRHWPILVYPAGR